MSISNKPPSIMMELCETDICVLQKFIEEKLEGEFTEECLILYDFATDCRYLECIQPELMKYLLPFYFKAIEQAILYKNKIAINVYFEFNRMLFFNQKNFRHAVGETEYQNTMWYYVKQTIQKMEAENLHMLEWVSMFNTSIAFCYDNIERLFSQIFQGSLRIKYSFFQYLSVLLLKESDNLLAVNESRVFWTSDIWDFDDGYFTCDFFWSEDVVELFDKEINRERIEDLFNDVKLYMRDLFESETVELFREEMDKSFTMGVFCDRKKEFLKKISYKGDEHKYWDITF